MTNEKKVKEIASRNIPNDDYDTAASYEHCKLMLMEMAEYKDELIQKFKHHADEMYSAMQNLSTDTSPIRKAMEDYRNFLFTEYYTD
ncbi:MAG: hypothetical protein J6X18_01095 [Bacteroidales bacterium]|nr:hypothetical protein [Bacteroidales bacterium]